MSNILLHFDTEGKTSQEQRRRNQKREKKKKRQKTNKRRTNVPRKPPSQLEAKDDVPMPCKFWTQ